jgi:hypothetical protein
MRIVPKILCSASYVEQFAYCFDLNFFMLKFQVGECLGTLIKTFKASFLPFFDELSVYITPMLVRQLNHVFVYVCRPYDLLCTASFYSDMFIHASSSLSLLVTCKRNVDGN